MYDFHKVQFKKLNNNTKLYYGVDLDVQREVLRKSENVKLIIEDIYQKAEAAIQKKYEVLPMSLYDAPHWGGIDGIMSIRGLSVEIIVHM